MVTLGRRACLTAVAACLAGCGRYTHLTVVQPRLVSSERELSLTSYDAYFYGDAGVAAFLLELPLPGATTGRHYRVYLRLADRLGRHTIGTPLPPGGFEAGFFMQLKGRHRGLTEFTSGTIELTRVGLAGPDKRAGTVHLRCGDGSVISGRFVADANARRVRAYERDSPDVHILLRGLGAKQPSSSPGFSSPPGANRREGG